MIKEKKCFGNSKAISFQGCGKLVNVAFRKYGLCSSCYAEFLTETEVGKLILSKALNKAQKPRIELEKAHKEHKEKKGIAGALLVTKTIVHAYVRKRDQFKPCISCGCQWNDKFQAGHYYPGGSFETLKFHLDNINGQCEQCNLFKSGNFENYTLNLPERIGKERFDNLVRFAEVDKQFSKIWDLENLKEIRENIKKLNK
ncbi:Bacteriophage lambda NinG [uncultured Caudovirales phage]|uniref:Protein ninG n=1 Tax=uncultured Caudovirales phage TaxID=2100421 RepID=A0A6J5LR77_9CAUD|nr:Bacteriophage lambda NinG [uncultured Caudovirales phage]